MKKTIGVILGLVLFIPQVTGIKVSANDRGYSYYEDCWKSGYSEWMMEQYGEQPCFEDDDHYGYENRWSMNREDSYYERNDRRMDDYDSYKDENDRTMGRDDSYEGERRMSRDDSYEGERRMSRDDFYERENRDRFDRNDSFNREWENDYQSRRCHE